MEKKSKAVYGATVTRDPLSIDFYRIWGQKMTKFTKWKVTKINWRIISKPHAHLQTIEKTCAKFQKVWYKIVWGVVLTRYPLSQHFHRIWGQKMTNGHKVEKVTKINARIISKPHAHLQTMEKTCAKFHKGWYKIVWVALMRYPLSIHWGQKMTKFTKWKKWQKII